MLVATNSTGSGEPSGAVSVTPLASGSSTTSGIECRYSYYAFHSSPSVNLQSTSSWTCDSSSRVLAANGIPDHDAGAFPNDGNPNTISAQTISATYTLAPVKTDTATVLGGPRGDIGFILNGIKIDAGTAGTCDDTGTDCDKENGGTGMWNIEALGQDSFDSGTDENNAHVQPTGTYHHHGMPEGFITLRGGGSNTMTLIGWAADGFPIYAHYGYSTATDASS
jgi:YHYH protein